ncbi:hypothetical protein PWT90_11205 [Aphanocladium album]|nr:hypothetical protein PWT90_11205 [Aphanocladium album]
MHSPRLCSLLVAAAGALAVTETHGGVDFEVRWTNTSAAETTPVKVFYESAAAHQAIERLKIAIQENDIAKDCLNANQSTSPAELYALKDCIVEAGGPTVFFKLLGEDIEKANHFWDLVISKSTPDRKKWVPARAYVRAFYGNTLKASNFALWSASPSADSANSRGNPEHYYKATEVTGTTTQVSNIFEGWGGVLSRFGTQRTNFTVPEFTIPDFGSVDYPNEWSLDSKFNSIFQRIGPKDLTSGGGKTFGILHIAVRDVPASESGVDTDAIEVYSAVWYPPFDQACKADRREFQQRFIRDEAYHMVVEIINLTLQAQKDCSSGRAQCHL